MSGRKKTRSKVKSPCCVAKMAVRIPTHSILRMAGQNEIAGAYSWEAKCRRLVGGLTNQRKIGGEPFFMQSPDLIFLRIVFQIGIRRFLRVYLHTIYRKSGRKSSRTLSTDYKFLSSGQVSNKILTLEGQNQLIH